MEKNVENIFVDRESNRQIIKAHENNFFYINMTCNNNRILGEEKRCDNQMKRTFFSKTT